MIVLNNGKLAPAKVSKFTIEKTNKNTAPYLIKKNAFGNNVPNRDTIISPNHAIAFGKNKFSIPSILAKYNENITQLSTDSVQSYYHLETPDYFNSLMIANNMPVETYSGD